MATKQDILIWFLKGRDTLKATHMIIVCDTFEWEDYPVYVSSMQNVHEQVVLFDGSNMQKVMEIYDLSKDISTQLDEYRSFNY